MDGEEDEVELLYPTSEEWFTEYWSWVYRRSLGRSTALWCECWWAHPEAVIRVEALWRSWEAARQADPMSGIATWMVNTADPMMSQLLSPEGPFKACYAGHVEAKDGKERLPDNPAPDTVS